MVISPHHSAAAVYEEPRAMYFLYSQHYRCFNVSRPTMLLEKCASARPGLLLFATALLSISVVYQLSLTFKSRYPNYLFLSSLTSVRTFDPLCMSPQPLSVLPSTPSFNSAYQAFSFCSSLYAWFLSVSLLSPMKVKLSC